MAGLGGKKRQEMMQNPFGDESEDEDEIESDHESNRQPENASDEGDGEQEHGENEVETDQSVDQREDSCGSGKDSDEKDEYGQTVITSRRQNVIGSGSERSENFYAENENEDVNQARRPSRPPLEEENKTHFSNSAPEIRRAFEDKQYESEYYNKKKQNGKAVGPPLELEIPLRPPLGLPAETYMIKASNIIGFDPKPFDPETYVEQGVYAADEGGSKNRTSLLNNIVRWREVQNPDGTPSIESNARFVQWSDGSIQLMIGNEVLDTTVQDTQLDQAHLFLRHGQGILQSQGRLERKMRVTPLSLSSSSHQQLVALVHSRHRKVHKVKRFITDVDPEKEKEQRQKADSQAIRTNALLNRRKEKVSRKYMPTLRRPRQLSPGFLEDAPDGEEEPDYHEPKRSARLRFKEDLEMEAQRTRRLINAKKKDVPKKTYMPAVDPSKHREEFCESEEEESEYETDVEEEKGEHEYEEEEEEEENEDVEEEAYEESEEDAEVKDPEASVKPKEIESDEDSPQRKITTHCLEWQLFMTVMRSKTCVLEIQGDGFNCGSAEPKKVSMKGSRHDQSFSEN